ncbi:MAG: hypothetical protein HY722_15530 [Planctomycetes bacterium]|nr:hypothetical protein [Planctomycetota bacterium]
MRTGVGTVGVLGVVAAGLAVGCHDGGARLVVLPATPGAIAGASTGAGGALPAAAFPPLPVPRAPSVLWPEHAPKTDLAAWFLARPWLAGRSLWASHADHGAHTPDPSELGAFGLGNGRCFALLGTAYPLNTLHNAIGPSYQEAGGFFGDIRSLVAVGGHAPPVRREWAWKVRRSAILITKCVADEIDLYTVDCAPPGHDAILRVLVVRNPGATDIPGVEVVTRIAGDGRPEGDRLVQDRGPYRLSMGVMGGGGGPASGELHAWVGTVPALGEVALALTLVMTRGGVGEAQVVRGLEAAGADRLIEETWRHWADWFAAGSELRLQDPKAQDLVEDMLVTGKVQQHEFGGLSPMSRYTKCFLRDGEGPLLDFLALGQHADARRILDYLHRASAHDGVIANSIGIDTDVAGPLPAVDWSQVGFMSGRGAAEAPSFIPWQVANYVAHTGDLALAGEQFEFCRQALLRQDFSPSGLLPWSGDEPFRHTIANALALVNPEAYSYAPHSSFYFVAAAERLAGVAVRLGRMAEAIDLQDRARRARDAVERAAWLGDFYAPNLLRWGAVPVPRPFEDVNLLPLHLGYLAPDDPRAEANLLAVLQQLGRGPGRVQSRSLISSAMDAYDGMVPGYLLENLSRLDHPDAEAAFNALEAVVQTSGETAEGHWADRDRVLVLRYDERGDGLGDVTARYRPWEGGLNVHGLLVYLLGMEADASAGRVRLAPHLPNGWGRMEARRLRLGTATYDLVVADDGAERACEVTNTGAAAFTVELSVSLPVPAVREVLVDARALPPGAYRAQQRWGRVRVSAPGLHLAPGGKARVTVRY